MPPHSLLRGVRERTGWWVHITSTNYKSETTYDHLLPAKWLSSHSQQKLSSSCIPCKGFLASSKGRGRSGTRPSCQWEHCQFPRQQCCMDQAGKAAQLRLLLSSLQITGFILLFFCCRPNIKCHFHANFQAWTQAFVFQRTLGKTSAFCTDGCSQDWGRIPLQLMRSGFTPYEIIPFVILLNRKRL